MYREVVGLTPRTEPDDDWAWFWAGAPGEAQSLALHKGALLFEEQSPYPPGERWGHVHCAFHVPLDRLEPAVQHVRSQGVEVYGPTRFDWMKAMSCFLKSRRQSAGALVSCGEGSRSHGREKGKTPPQPQAVWFQGEGAARRAYLAVQDAIFETPCELSTYRFLVRGIWHVAVMGEPPSKELGLRLDRALRSGDPVELPEEVVQALSERGTRERRKQTWIERHYL